MRIFFFFLFTLGICALLYGGMSYTIGSGMHTGTVLDNSTGLRWTRCSMIAGGIIDSTNGCTQTPVRYIWGNAITACENLDFAGRDDWRLPNIRELQSIVTHYKLHYPMINSSAFPNTEDSTYWSSTTYNSFKADPYGNSDAEQWAWSIDFYYGNVLLHHKTLVDDNNNSYVRCVAGP